LQAALGRCQLARLDAFVARRRAVAADTGNARRRGPPVASRPTTASATCYHRFVVAVERPLDPILAQFWSGAA